MEFIKKFYQDSLLFEVRDISLDVQGILIFKRELAQALFQEESTNNIIIKFKDVILKDNHSLGALLYARRYTKGRDGKCTLVFPNPKTMTLLKHAKLEKSFSIIEEEEVFEKMITALMSKESNTDRNVPDDDNKNEDDNSSDKYPVDADFKFFE